jgi:hypothetical protein
LDVQELLQVHNWLLIHINDERLMLPSQGHTVECALGELGGGLLGELAGGFVEGEL